MSILPVRIWAISDTVNSYMIVKEMPVKREFSGYVRSGLTLFVMKYIYPFPSISLIMC